MCSLRSRYSIRLQLNLKRYRARHAVLRGRFQAFISGLRHAPEIRTVCALQHLVSWHVRQVVVCLGQLGGQMRYKIALTRSDEGVSVSVPGLPGCWSQGASETEALSNIRDAIVDYFAVRDELLRDADVREVEVA